MGLSSGAPRAEILRRVIRLGVNGSRTFARGKDRGRILARRFSRTVRLIGGFPIRRRFAERRRDEILRRAQVHRRSFGEQR